MTVELLEPFRRRRARFLRVLEHDGWRLKVIGIAYAGDSARPELVEAAEAAARDILPLPAVGNGRYGAGFLGVHDGRGSCFVFVDWWADENELHHQVLISPVEDPTALAPAGPDEAAACVWDLAVMAFEREAWVRHVLEAETPDVERYLAERIDAEI
ncbi:MAG TPA: isochorismatase [Acidimicrobiia bacterium]|nr:isochorismatase [Acidimicrobiia bacterium]